MGVLKGSLSYTRFVTIGELPEDDLEGAWIQCLESHAFREIQPHSEEEVSAGWVRFEDPFRSEWEPGELITSGGVVVLTMRIDTLKIPALTLRAYTNAAEKERLQQLQREKLTRAERDTVKVEVRKQLRTRSLARMQLIEAAWNVSSGELRLMSTSSSVVSLFVELFEKSFALQLRQVGPLTLLWLRGVEEEDLDRLELLEPERFHLSRR